MKQKQLFIIFALCPHSQSQNLSMRMRAVMLKAPAGAIPRVLYC